MSAEKHEQLIESGQLNDDGTRTAACPTCGRPFGPGEALAAPEPVAVGMTPGEGDEVEITDADVADVGEVLGEGEQP